MRRPVKIINLKNFESKGLSTAGAAIVAVVILIAVVAVLYFSPGATPAATSSQSTAASSSASTAAVTTTTSTTTTTTTTSTSTTSAQVVSTITTSASKVQVVIPLGVGTNMSLNFEPSVLTVVVGVNNTIEWVDQDSSAPHTVTATSVPSGATMFNSNSSTPLTKGSTFTVTLTVPGTYHYHCSFHPAWMMGTIVVKQA